MDSLRGTSSVQAMVESWRQHNQITPFVLISVGTLELRRLSSAEKKDMTAQFPEGDTDRPWFAAYALGHLYAVSDDYKLLKLRLKKTGYKFHDVSQLG